MKSLGSPNVKKKERNQHGDPVQLTDCFILPVAVYKTCVRTVQGRKEATKRHQRKLPHPFPLASWHLHTYTQVCFFFLLFFCYRHMFGSTTPINHMTVKKAGPPDGREKKKKRATFCRTHVSNIRCTYCSAYMLAYNRLPVIYRLYDMHVRILMGHVGLCTCNQCYNKSHLMNWYSYQVRTFLRATRVFVCLSTAR